MDAAPPGLWRLWGMTAAEARAWAASIGLPAYRGEQILTGLHRPGVRTAADIKGLGAELAARLDALGPVLPGTETTRQESRDGTVKSLLRLHDGKQVECVSIPTAVRHTICVSSQVGCAVGCTFCASGLNGVERDLDAAEIVYQIAWHHQRRPVTNVVFMGSGEPLFNYDQVLRAIRALGDEGGLGMGRRRITVSTSGVPKRIRQLADDEPQVTLAFSIHAADNETRSRIVPLNRRWPLDEVLEAMADYSAKVGRRMTLEYVLLAEANMTPGHAERLAAVARRFGAHINLIPYNPVMETPHHRPTTAQVKAFAERVEALGGHLTVRGQRGADIDAACGQLKRRASPAVESGGAGVRGCGGGDGVPPSETPAG
jgi:23S rRNA (adenine2503-C2)-methyltransferase